MVDRASSFNPQAEVLRLSRAIAELTDALRAQRDVLRQRGMSLPPGALTTMAEIYQQLDQIAGQFAGENVELNQLRALAQTGALINSSLDIDTVLNEVMDTVISLTGAERGYIVLRDEQTGEMQFRIARNLDRETITKGSFIVSRTIVEEVARTGEPVVTTNAQSDPRFSGQESVMIHALRSILCVPLVVRGTITGVVYADNRIRDGLFGDQELSLLLTFANQAAIAIENARLFKHVQSTLAEVTETKELIDNIFASIASGVITTDVEETVTTYNAAATRILATDSTAVLGYRLSTCLPVIYHHVRDLISLVMQQNHQHIMEIAPEVPTRGPTNLNLILTPLKNNDVTEGMAIVVDDLTEIKQRDATLDVVRRYLPPAMVDNIQNLDGLGLGGERRHITTLFVETRPFSSFAPNLNPQEMMEFLNLYLTRSAEAIHMYNGVIDKFMGNEIMVLFNTQLNPSDDHAWLAVQAALRIAENLLTLTTELGEPPVPFHRLGIHTGIATLGNVGSSYRREFTAIGDSVNLAKRLQENAAPGEIIISRDTFEHCQDEITNPAHRIRILERPSLQVKGRRQVAQIFAIQRSFGA